MGLKKHISRYLIIYTCLVSILIGLTVDTNPHPRYTIAIAFIFLPAAIYLELWVMRRQRKEDQKFIEEEYDNVC